MAGRQGFLGWLVGSRTRQGRYPETFDAELAWQSWKILRPSGLICMVAWLPYLRFDEALHPGLSVLRWLRLGLSIAGLGAVLYSLHPRARRHSHLALFALTLYLQCATGLITGLTVGESSYFGGFLFVLMLAPLAPLRKRLGFTLLAAPILIFAITGYLTGMTFEGAARGYLLQDLASTAMVSFVFVELNDHLRRRSYLKGRTVQEQNEQIEDDKERIDALLLNILPAPIAEELKREGVVRPVFHRQVSVVFADFVGFTSHAAGMPPDALVQRLDSHFCRFDAIMDRRGVEKLKTIGDAYMFAAGLPEPTKTHALDACLAAIDMMRDVEEHKDEGFGGMRIGVHSGPLMAGMVGARKFAYDVWGDTVNTAARMESSGLPGSINVSRTTRDLIADFFHFEHRGPVSVKGKGELDMYFLERIKPELSKDDRGYEPNEEFWRRYRAMRTG